MPRLGVSAGSTWVRLNFLTRFDFVCTYLTDKFFRKSVDPEPLGAFGLAEELVRLLKLTVVQSDNVATAQTIVGLMCSLW